MSGFRGTREQLINALRATPIRGGMAGQAIAEAAADMLTALATQLAERDARIAALTKALEGCVAAIEHADMADGVCCCGDMMEGHSDPMSCGHSPVDQGHYHSHQVLASARAALTTDKELKT